MWDRACDMLDRAERMQRQFFRLAQTGGVATWEPPIDVFESESELLIRAALPGVDREALHIELQGAELRFSAQRRLPSEVAERAIRRLEIPYGQMQRTLVLPAGQFRIVAHAYTNGCLEIRLQRTVRDD
jgi:HSP20 family molecular chaperone IbpA